MDSCLVSFLKLIGSVIGILLLWLLAIGDIMSLFVGTWFENHFGIVYWGSLILFIGLAIGLLRLTEKLVDKWDKWLDRWDGLNS